MARLLEESIFFVVLCEIHAVANVSFIEQRKERKIGITGPEKIVVKVKYQTSTASGILFISYNHFVIPFGNNYCLCSNIW